MIKEVKNKAFEVDNLFNVNSVIALNCIHLMNQKNQKKSHYARGWLSLNYYQKAVFSSPVLCNYY